MTAPQDTAKREILKACPFCGGTPDEGFSLDVGPSVFCNVCGICIGEVYDCYGKWNTRPLESSLQSLLMTAEKENDRLRNTMAQVAPMVEELRDRGIGAERLAELLLPLAAESLQKSLAKRLRANAKELLHPTTGEEGGTSED